MVGVTRDTHTDDVRADLRDAYERGRRDERSTRRRHPILMTFTFIAAAVGLVVLVLAAVNGSFGHAGNVVDQNLAVAANKAEPAVRDVAANAAQSVREAATPDNTATTTTPATTTTTTTTGN